MKAIGLYCFSGNVQDCTDIRNQGYTTSGVYKIFRIDLQKDIQVYCDLKTDNKGWLVGISIVIDLVRMDFILCWLQCSVREINSHWENEKEKYVSIAKIWNDIGLRIWLDLNGQYIYITACQCLNLLHIWSDMEMCARDIVTISIITSSNFISHFINWRPSGLCSVIFR